MLATLILLTATALPARWELHTSVDVSYWRKADVTQAESLEHCEQMRDNVGVELGVDCAG